MIVSGHIDVVEMSVRMVKWGLRIAACTYCALSGCPH